MSDISIKRTTLKQNMSIPATQIPLVVKNSMLADIDAMEKNIDAFFEELKPIAERRFVMMKNKQVWYDRENVAIYPKFEKIPLPKMNTVSEAAKTYKAEMEGFMFRAISLDEARKSFLENLGNPYIKNNRYLHFPIRNDKLLTDDGHRFLHINNSDSSWNDHDEITVVPICRLKRKNSERVSMPIAIHLWLQHGLIPEGVSNTLEQSAIDLFKLKNYIHADDEAITFDKAAFTSAVFDGLFTDTIFGCDFHLAAKIERVLRRDEKFCASPEALKSDLLNCDKIRADLQPYDEKRLTDINLGHWELFEPTKDEDIEIDIPQGEPFVARPPQMDVVENGTCAIDFGTKSTVVVCRSQDARLLRVGKGNYDKAPTPDDYENPTVIELRDMEEFMAAYNARDGRPFTQWEQMTVSHQAAEAIFQNDEDSSVYYSVFGELKQWANAKGKRLMLKDRQGKVIELKPYDELGEGDFDPIELYAYYLGLYINNMHNRIYLDYLLSFPVTYESAVREHIRRSFARGIRKSLPSVLLADEETMEMFRVSAGASEPAAYAISALEEYGLQPAEVGQSVSYGVFDFGGGTTDFDFGMEEIPENGRRKFVIRRFGAGGDSYLGGENILDLLAYEVYQDNLEEMRTKHIPFVLPPACKRFAGSETLVFSPADASQQAYMNSKRVAKEMRCVWERRDDYQNRFSQPLSIMLFSTQKQDGSDKQELSLKVDVSKLEKVIEKRIRHGVENFFTAMMHAFDDRPAYPIHIFLAGNSCKAAGVRAIFDEFIKKYEKVFAAGIHASKGQEIDTSGTFLLHPPLGMNWEGKPMGAADGENPKDGQAVSERVERLEDLPPEQAEQKASSADDAANQSSAKIGVARDFDRLRTGKTGVAFGLLRTRIGGRDVKIIDEDAAGSEIPFRYFLGNIDRENRFYVRIGMKIPYGQWVLFAYADDPEFELYYTREPKSLQGEFTESDVERVRCRFDAAECSDEDGVGVYIRKVKPDTVEYAVGRECDFSSKDFQGKKYTKQLKG